MFQREEIQGVERRFAAAAVLCGAVLFAGCGGDDESAEQAEASSSGGGSTSVDEPVTTDTPGTTEPGPTATGTTTPTPASSGGGDETTGGGDETTGDEIPDGVIPGISDEFNDAATLPNWTRRHEDEGEAAGFSTLDIDQSATGRLTFVPTTGGWFGDFVGPLLFKEVSGDFMVEVAVRAGNVQDPTMPPTQAYNSAGVMLRDPASVPGDQSWVVHNVGFQDGVVATEGKTTFESMSSLEIVEGTHEGRLRICRLGTEVILTRRLSDETEFTERHRFTREFPDTLQVGLALNGWNSLGQMPNSDEMPDLHAEFDYIRFFELTDESDCLADE